MTTIGKYRHLSRASTPAGHFVIAAVDHRTNLLEKLNAHAPEPLTHADFAAFKADVVRALAPESSAVLMDPAYGIAHAVVDQIVPGGMGLLAPVEVTDYGLHPSERSIDFIPGWSVRKIKLSGGDGVKLLLPYHPESDNVEDKYDVIRQIVDACAANDIPFFLEPIPYALDPEKTLSNAELLDVSVEMATLFSEMDVDVLKLPFPVDHRQSTDEAEWQAACAAVDKACTVPWALLSAGVTYDIFLAQSRIACEAGASGVIVGRAVWAEAVELQDADRAAFLAKTAPARMRELAAVCAEHATPWQANVDTPSTALNWYETYHQE